MHEQVEIEGRSEVCRVFGALSDPTRLSIFERLSAADLTAGEIAAPYAVSQPAISRHLAVLERAGLVERRVDRQWRVCRARPEGVAAASEWLERQRAFWEGSLDRLERVLTERKTDTSNSKGNKSDE